MKTDWSDAEIEGRAAEVARAIAKATARARTEADLRIAVNPILTDFAKEVGLEVDDRHEVLVGRGTRADSIYGRVVIEYESPGSLSEKKSAAKNQHAIKQVTGYLQDLSKQESQQLGRMVGVVLDGARIIFVRWRKDDWEVGPARAVDKDSVTDLLLRLRALSGKALLPENLVRDFGGIEARGEFTASDIAARCVGQLYRALVASDSPKVEALFAQWRLLFSEVCGYEFASPKLDLADLAASYGVTLKRETRVKGRKTSEDAERLFFCIHTYYATLITLLAAEIVTYYMGRLFPSYLGRLEGLGERELRDELVDLHSTGGVFGHALVQNFLEGDFFSWFLEAWNEDLAGAVQSMVRALRQYDPATFQVEPDETRDLLKKLYQYLLPKKLRHDLGEYYTPDWLAELVLEEVGYDGDISKRILDPACGSGTFPTLEIKRAKEWAREKPLSDRETLDGILAGIVGFDLNPLAVITARTNYLIALGELLRYRKGPVEIPIYLCDAVLTPSEARQLSLRRCFPLATAVGVLEVPLDINTQDRVSALTRLLEQAVQGAYEPDEFLLRAARDLGLGADELASSREVLSALYGKLRELDGEGKNGIWARIIKNFFAPVFTVAERKFDYLAGNLPWINWESLPDQYRKSTQGLWEDYGLFSLKGWRARMGGGKKDISALFLYVAADKYLAKGGNLGFLITESLFKTSGAGEGFRRFELPAEPGEFREGLCVLGVHDLVAVSPFEGAANRTAAVFIRKGKPTRYPVSYTAWRRRPGRKLEEGMALDRALSATLREKHAARPVVVRRGAPWITGPKQALQAIEKAVGKSYYRAWAGACTWLNGIYWVRILERLPEGLLLIENLHDVGKIEVKPVQARVEPALVYPLLRGRDIHPWKADPQDCILMVQDPHSRKGYSEGEMRLTHPMLYQYLKGFEVQLRERSGFRKYFEPADPFYSIYDVGTQTFAPVKVVWRQMVPDLRPAVVGTHDGKEIVPQHVITFVPFTDAADAHYFCGVLGSSPARFIGASYSTGKSFGAPHILDHVKVPRFDRSNKLHRHLASLSQAAHKAVRSDPKKLAEIEGGIDEAAAELWGITPKELAVLQKALRHGKPVAESDDPDD